MAKIFYVNGCSHTAGAEMEYVKSKGTEYDKQHSYAKHIHNNLFSDYEYINHAYSGNSNESMALDTINSLSQMLEHTPASDMFVMLGLTDPNRYHFDVPPNWQIYRNRIRFFTGLDINPDYRYNCATDFPYAKELWTGINAMASNFEQEYRVFAKDYSLLVNFLESNNLQYRMIQTLHCHDPKFVPEQYNKIYEHYFNNSHVVNKKGWNNTMFEWLKDKGYSNSIDGRTGHYREDAHIAWADYLLSRITL